MNILVMDGQGGRLGAQLVRNILERFPQAELTAIGTTATATAAMVKAGAKKAATGTNPAIVACRKARVIIGPIGIVIADAMLGEITPEMAVAVGQADAVRILLPVNRCENQVAGVGELSTSALMDDAMARLEELLSRQTCCHTHG